MPNRVWLNHLINIVVQRAHTKDGGGWRRSLGAIEIDYEEGIISSCLTADEFDVTESDTDRRSTMDHFTHCLRVALHTIGCSVDPSRDAVLLLSVAAYASGLVDDGPSVMALFDEDEHEDRVSRSNELGARIGRVFIQGIPPNTDALGDHPFLHIRRHGEFSVFKRLAATVRDGLSNLGGVPESHTVYAHLGWNHTRLHRAVSASIALAHVDGIIDGEERDLINALIEAGRFDDTEQAMLAAEFDKPLTINELCIPVIDPFESQFLFRLLFLGVHINGRYHPNEKSFLEALARQIGEEPARLDDHEDVALVTFEANYGLLDRIAPSGLLSRVRERLFERAEDVLKRNAKRIIAEVAETRELLELLAESAVRPLTQDEEAKVKEQLMDFVRAIPALAIFAAPGGSILLPLIARYLRINFAPSSFVDRATLGGTEMDDEPPKDD